MTVKLLIQECKKQELLDVAEEIYSLLILLRESYQEDLDGADARERRILHRKIKAISKILENEYDAP